jgi:hypothetical protein
VPFITVAILYFLVVLEILLSVVLPAPHSNDYVFQSALALVPELLLSPAYSRQSVVDRRIQLPLAILQLEAMPWSLSRLPCRLVATYRVVV